MKIYELIIYIKLKKSVHFRQNPEFLSKNINHSFLLDENLKLLHTQKSIKPYCIDFLRHLGEKKDEFLGGEEIFFKIRTIYHDLADTLRFCLENSKNLDFTVISTKINEFEPKFIKSLYTMTPAVVTISVDNKAINWSRENSDIITLKHFLEVNLKSKFRQFIDNDAEFDDEIIELIEIKNHKAFAFNYKKGRIYAYRYQIYFASNLQAQNLAKIGLALGIGEKGSLAFGFSRIGDER